MLAATRLDQWIYGTLILYSLVFSLSVPMANFAMDAGMLLLLGRLFLSRDGVSVDKKWLLLAGTFLLVCLLSAWNGYDRQTSLVKTWQVGYNLVFPFILGSAAVKSAAQRRQLLVGVAISLFIACAYEIYLGMHGLGSEGGFLGRMQLAAQIVQAFPLLITGAVCIAWKRADAKFLLLGLGLTAIVALLFTGIRGAWVALGAASLGTFAMVPVKLKHKIAFAILMTLLAGLILLSQPLLQNKLVQGATFEAQSVSERFLMWKSATHMIQDYPALGIGLGNFGDLYEQKYILPEAQEGRHPHPHNIYLQTLAETGIIGFAAFAAVWIHSFRVMIRNLRRTEADFWHKAVPVAVVGFLVYGVTDNLIYHFPAGFQFCWFLIGAGWNRVPGATDQFGKLEKSR